MLIYIYIWFVLISVGINTEHWGHMPVIFYNPVDRLLNSFQPLCTEKLCKFATPAPKHEKTTFQFSQLIYQHIVTITFDIKGNTTKMCLSVIFLT
jgi:hypothetical protein